jgi:hypothetical protein
MDSSVIVKYTSVGEVGNLLSLIRLHYLLVENDKNR